MIFLYNVDNKSLLGPFTALTEGGDELDAGTWIMDVDEQIPYDDIKVTWEELHTIQNANEKLLFLNDNETCKLSDAQTQQALDLLKDGSLYLYAKGNEDGHSIG